MAISLSMWGYVEARGTADARYDPTTRHNANALDDLRKIARVIDALPAAVLQPVFTLDRGAHSCLRGVIFEREPFGRLGLAELLNRIGGFGTLVVPSLAMLTTKSGATKREYELMRTILDRQISVIACDDPFFQRFVRMDSIKKADLTRFTTKAADSRGVILRKTIALENIGLVDDSQPLGAQGQPFLFLGYRHGDFCEEKPRRSIMKHREEKTSPTQLSLFPEE